MPSPTRSPITFNGALNPDGTTRIDVRAVLDGLPLLQFLPPDARELVINSFEPGSFAFGTPIVRENEPADALYVLVAGRARILKAASANGGAGGEITLSQLRVGDTFGEMGLLEHTTRSATVRASSDVEVLRLDKSVFEALLRSRPEIRQYFELQTKHRHLHNFFREMTPFAKLPGEALQMLLEELVQVEVPKGSTVIRQGDPAGPMYIVAEGRLRVHIEEDGRRKPLAYLRRGDFFGELSLFRGVARTATVEAASDCKLLELRPETFRRLVAYPDFTKQLDARIKQYDYKHVARVPLDFAEELLPADVGVLEKTGPDQLSRPSNGAASLAGPTAEDPFTDGDGHFIKARRRRRKVPQVWQIDEMDCGAACLAMICRYHGRAVSLARIRQLVHTSLDGTSLRALVHAASELGLAARSVKASAANVDRMPLPAIVHWEGNHWIVLADISAKGARVVDPGFGARFIPRAEFDEKWSGYAALFDYTEKFDAAPVTASSLTWLWTFFTPYIRLMLKAVGLAVIVSALQMLLPIFTQVIVDRVLVEQDTQLLHILIGAMIGVLVFMTAAVVVQRYLLSFAAVRIDASTLDFLTRRLLALPMSYFNTRRTGDIQRRLDGIRQVRQFVVQNGVAGLSAIVQLGATLTLMFLYSPLLAGVFLTTVPLYAAMMYYSQRFLRPLFDKLEEVYGRYQSFQIDAIKGIETVKAMGAEGAFRGLMLHQFQTVARRRFKADFTMLSYDGVIQMVSFLSVAMFLWVGATQVMDGHMTIGGLVAFNSLVALANSPIMTLLSVWDDLQVSSVLLNRMNDVLENEPEQGHDHSKLTAVRTLEGRVSFQHVGFRYGGAGSPLILDDLTFEVAPNRMVAIVGRSGSGKTTLIKLLSGLLEPTEGTIAFDGIDLRALNYRDLRRHIGFVLQENHLFDDTIARNIAFGEEEPDMDAVLWASRVANAHEFIERLPLGYDTKVGESGISISGGQRQRIAIARAVYRRPPILVFDEATSALDTESERAVKDNLDKLLEGRTSFVIAHRLSTVRDADQILVMERGRLVEHGTHEQLMEHQGLYYYLCSQQLGVD